MAWHDLWPRDRDGNYCVPIITTTGGTIGDGWISVKDYGVIDESGTVHRGGLAPENGEGIARLPLRAEPDYSGWMSDWDLLPDAG